MKNLSGKYLKCGDLYIKFDEDGLPNYGFLVYDTTIKKFFNMRNDKETEEIILPPILTKKLEEQFLDDEGLKYIGENLSENMINRYSITINTYLKGYVNLEENCFDNLKNKKIIITTNYPIKFQDDAFLKCENISFVLPNNQTLYNIHECYNGYFDYEHSEWNLIGYKSFPLNRLDAGASDYTITKNSKYNVIPSISISKKL